ncbi:MAG TPA: hypothetical protein VGG86_00700 [Roseiarcus sp.]
MPVPKGRRRLYSLNGYTSFDQCWATIGAEGGWCLPNPFPGTPYGTGYTWSGPKR